MSSIRKMPQESLDLSTITTETNIHSPTYIILMTLLIVIHQKVSMHLLQEQRQDKYLA